MTPRGERNPRTVAPAAEAVFGAIASKHGFEFNISTDVSPQYSFFKAVIDGDLRRLRDVVNGMDEDDRDSLPGATFQGAGALHAASDLGFIDVCRYLVEELGCDVNAIGDMGTPLAFAAISGKVVAVRYLLDHGADPNKQDNSGSVPLHWAAENGHDGVAQLLLSRGASVDRAGSHGTPLHTAAACGKIGVMKILLYHHADPNKVSEESRTPLIAILHAASEGLPESVALMGVRLLIKAGADVNFTNPDTPLVVATRLGLTDCIKYLLEAGADPNIRRNNCGSTPIEIAASYDRRNHMAILFPFTSPIQALSNWSVQGIIDHVKSRHPKPQDEPHTKDEKSQLKLHGEKAFKTKDYLSASKFYTKAIEVDPADEKLYSNRSLCYLHMGEAQKALIDADACIRMRPEWKKGYYRKGAALMSLKEYKDASDVFMAGLKLDPRNSEMEKVFWEAIEAMKKDRVAENSINSID